MQKRKIIQITLISAGFLLIIFTYFLYPVIKRSNNLEAKRDKQKNLIGRFIDRQVKNIKNLKKKNKP